MAIENAKTLNVRIKNKYDSYENWASSGLVLEAGEIAIAYTTVDVKVDNGTAKHPALLMKVGDGEKTFANLPWLSAKAADVLEAVKSEAGLTAFINNIIANSGLATDGAMTDLSDRVDVVEGNIETLNGDVNTAGSVAKAIADAIAALNLADTYAAKVHGHEIADVNGLADALAGLQGKGDYAAEEHKHEIDDVNGLADAIADAKKAGTDANAALETYKGTNDAAVKKVADDLAAEAEAARAAEKANTDAITAMKDHASVDSFADVMAEIAKKQDTIPENTYDAYGAAAQALTDAKAYTDEKDEAMGERVDALGEAVTAEKERAEGIEAGLQGAIDAINDADTGILKQAKDYADGKDEAIAAAASAAATADEKAVAAQNDVDALELYVGTIPATATATNIVAYVQEKTAGIATEGAMNGLADRVTAVEGDVATIKGDYLKAADKTELSNAIAAEKERAEAAEADLQTQINTIMNNPDTEGVINSINEFTQYIADHGEIAEGFRVDIDANKKAIEDHEALAAQTYETKEDATAKYDELSELIAEKAVQADWNQNDETAADYIKNRPFYEVESEGVVIFDGTVEGFADLYDSGSYSTGYTKQINSPILADGLYEVIYDGKKYTNVYVVVDYGYRMLGDKQDLGFKVMHRDENIDQVCFTADEPGETHTFKITQIVSAGELVQIDEKFIPNTIARVVDVENAVSTAEQNAKDYIDNELSTKVGDETVAAQIEAAMEVAKTDASNKDAVVLAEAQKAAAAVQSALDTHTGNGDIHVTAEQKTTWDSAVQTVTAAADSGLKATKTGTDVAIAIDDSIVWVFDCGTSAV